MFSMFIINNKASFFLRNLSHIKLNLKKEKKEEKAPTSVKKSIVLI